MFALGKAAPATHIPAHMPTPALKIRNLRKVYRRGNVAVDDLSLTIGEGDFFGFLGPNGAAARALYVRRAVRLPDQRSHSRPASAHP